MKRLFLTALLALVCGSAIAAESTIQITVGSGTSMLGAAATTGANSGAFSSRVNIGDSTNPDVGAVVDANGLHVVGSMAPLTSSNLSGSVSVTNTFQSVQSLTTGRIGCAIQNNGANPMYVYFGPIGSASKAHAFLLPASTSTSSFVVGCAVGGLGVLTDQVSITGTSGDAFTANFQ
jgi:hypothetical protein